MPDELTTEAASAFGPNARVVCETAARGAVCDAIVELEAEAKALRVEVKTLRAERKQLAEAIGARAFASSDLDLAERIIREEG